MADIPFHPAPAACRSLALENSDMSPLFPDMTFRRILSLGSACEPAWHLRRTGRYHSKSPFDWLVTPWDSMVRVLADDGAALGSRFSTALNGTSVRCGAYDVLYR